MKGAPEDDGGPFVFMSEGRRPVKGHNGSLTEPPGCVLYCQLRTRAGTRSGAAASAMKQLLSSYLTNSVTGNTRDVHACT